MIKFFKSCWKQVAGIVGVLAIITSIITFYATLAKTEDLKKIEALAVKKDELKVFEIKIASAIEQVQKNLQLQQDVTRLNNISDQMIKTRGLIKQYPRDKELKEDYESLKIEREKIQKKIDKGVN